jgi:hypothetical protein
MNYLEEMFITLVLVLMAFVILFRLAQVMIGVFSKFKPIRHKGKFGCASKLGRLIYFLTQHSK